MITLTELTDDQLRLITEDRRDHAAALIGTDHFYPAMERVRECGGEWDRRTELLKHRIAELDRIAEQEAIARATAASLAAVHDEVARYTR